MDEEPDVSNYYQTSLNILYLLFIKYNMRVLSFVMVAGFSRGVDKLLISNLYNPIYQNNVQKNITVNTFSNDFINKNKRMSIMLINKYKNNDINKCYYCYGTGYPECNKCFQRDCVKCENTGFEKCKFCGGSGRGGPRMMPMREMVIA